MSNVSIHFCFTLHTFLPSNAIPPSSVSVLCSRVRDVQLGRRLPPILLPSLLFSNAPPVVQEQGSPVPAEDRTLDPRALRRSQ